MTGAPGLPGVTGVTGVTGDLCQPDYQSSVSLERLVKALKYVHPALKACCPMTHEHFVLIVPF